MPLQDEFEWHILITDIKSSYMYMCYGMSPTFLGFQDNLQNLFLLSYEFRVTYLDQQPVIVEFIFTITVFYGKKHLFLFYTTLWVHGYMKHTITVVFTSKKKNETHIHVCMYVCMYVCNNTIFHVYYFLYKYQAMQYQGMHLWIGGGGGGRKPEFKFAFITPREDWAVPGGTAIPGQPMAEAE